MEQPISVPVQKISAEGVLCGAGSARCGALGFVAARHGVLSGMSPLVLALHRFVWPGIVLLPVIATNGLSDLGGLGWRRGILITAVCGFPRLAASRSRCGATLATCSCLWVTAPSYSHRAPLLAGLSWRGWCCASRCRHAGSPVPPPLCLGYS